MRATTPLDTEKDKDPLAGKRVVCYCRVSTSDQDPDCQIIALRDFAARRGITIGHEYIDIVTGSIEKRHKKKLKAPAYDQLMEDVRARKIDVILVWKYDRLARSLFALLAALQLFQDYDVDFLSTTQAIDTSTASGKLLYQVLAAFADYAECGVMQSELARS